MTKTHCPFNRLNGDAFQRQKGTEKERAEHVGSPNLGQKGIETVNRDRDRLKGIESVTNKDRGIHAAREGQRKKCKKECNIDMHASILKSIFPIALNAKTN